MSTEPEVIVPAPDLNALEPPDPTIPAPEVVPALPELRYEYQPTDEKGNKLGGKQVILYRTPDELAEKLRDQNVQLVRKLREVTRQNRLGQLTAEELPADVDRLPKAVQFKEKPLSIDERYKISQDLNDPEKFEEARDKLFESATGVAPKEFREYQNQQQFTVNQLLARTNATVFMEQNPDFYRCEENLEVITDWMIKNELQPTVKNFETAHSVMKEAGLLLESPIVREEAPAPPPAPVLAPVTEPMVANSQPPAEEPTRISGQPQPQVTRQAHVPSGLNSRIASNTGRISEMPTMTLAEIDRMPSDEYKRRLADPKFAELVNKLENSRPPKPRRS